MPQIFQVLKCYKCSIFQIHQTKKSNKFECKMCREKQSIKRHYGIGTGKDCRMHVQKLNALQGNTKAEFSIESNSSDEEYENCKIDGKIPKYINNSISNLSNESKWSTFIDKPKDTETIEDQMFLEDTEVFLEVSQKTNHCKLKSKRKAKADCEESCDINKKCKVQFKSNLRLSNKNNTDKDDMLRFNDRNNAQLVCTNEQNLVIGTDLEKPVVLQTVDKKSKWAQYVDTEKCNAELHNDGLSNHDSKESVSIADNLFSLCDDSYLDQVLDI